MTVAIRTTPRFTAGRFLFGTTRRLALVAMVMSAIAWTIWNETRTFAHPWGDLSKGSYTDHFSHMNAARAFTRVGLDLWRRGASELFPVVTPVDLARMPDDVRRGGSWSGSVHAVPGWRADKPWVTSWSHNPRLYPPGDLVLVAPIAFLYHTTNMSLERANRSLITLFIILTHVALFFALDLVLRDSSLTTPILWVSFALVYSEAIHWTLEGFYDFAAAAPLLVCARCLRERRGFAAAVAYSAAAFLHFRALFFAPMALYAADIVVRDKPWRGFVWKQYTAAASIVLMAIGTVGVLVMLLPVLTTLPVNNPVHLGTQPWTSAPVLSFGIVLLVAAAVLSYARAWFDLLMLSWMGAMVFYLREAYPWHVTILFAWLVMPVLRVRDGGVETVRGVRLFVLGYATLALFRNPLWPGYWIEKLT